MESFFHREKGLSDMYPDVPAETVKHAEQYLILISEGTIKSINLEKSDALASLKKLRAGQMEDYTVEADAANYIDYINERKAG